VGDHAFSALISPLEELVSRRGWWVLSLLGFILTYALCYNIWASFAYPFYLEQMHYTKDQVAFASKIFGIIMTMTGISLGGYLFTKVGRFPTVFLGAILPRWAICSMPIWPMARRASMPLPMSRGWMCLRPPWAPMRRCCAC
jgi:PAT family beta-lactamase induction signal transducer AmpG